MRPINSLPLDRNVRFDRVLYIRDPITHAPYAVALVTLPSGKQSTVLACGKVHNLDQLNYLEGCDVNVIPTENGLKLSPLDQQPEEAIQGMFARMEKGSQPEETKDSAPIQEVQAPVLVQQKNPPTNPAEELEHPAIPVVGEMVAYMAQVCTERGIPGAILALLPPVHNYPGES